ncbi:MAG: NAD(P)/FAD-dependent oxidoreductase [Deltaproteobacteria bacterium]|nr:NAD(P)/FAD-dependent oxidoreductase [Deltaproteobacteria bacterium]
MIDKANEKHAIIIGAGPAGLTAAYELAHRTDIRPIIFEKTSDIGGISKSVNYKGNRIDIGGHRFFSKSDRVMAWWLNIMRIQGAPAKDERELGTAYSKHKITSELNSNGPDPEHADLVMLVRHRLSRIFYLRSFFDYPISLNLKTISNLGIIRILKIGFSYIIAKLFPTRHEKSLKDFFINRFGKELYQTFFKDYTEKVWGVACDQIKPEWGAQRIKGLSISKAIQHAIHQIAWKDETVAQNETETSLIERFLYPKYGPGQMWEAVAKTVQLKGGQLFLTHEVVGLNRINSSISEVIVTNAKTGETMTYKSSHVFSTMPVKDLVASMNGKVPQNVDMIAKGLQYRDFITVGVLLDKLKIKNDTKIPTLRNLVPDNWIYIQEKDVKLGRLQIFNNWSPYMVKDNDKVWIGLEYFCIEDDELWSKNDDDFAEFAIKELSKIEIIDEQDVLDYVVLRMPKAYPAYFGTYDQFEEIKDFTNRFENLFLIGRNGMHKYNNQDHSMLTAMTAVDNIISGIKSKENIWAVNAEEEYHESKSRS